MSEVLVLNIDYTPLEVVSWREAMEKIVSGKVELVQDYTGRAIRSAYRAFPFPAVVRLIGRYARRRIRLSRANILARDAYTCQYCGVQPRKKGGAPILEELTIDHVVPRAQGVNGWVTLPWSGRRARITSWVNVLTACSGCNARKADRTPGQASMAMAKKPRAPTTIDIAWMSIIRVQIPDEWKAWLPEGSPWRDYWEADLAT
tara:strand:- start:2340 stop:2948 length:609 start_codon:yes stop_codon:yes gene_type:complete